MKLDGKVVVITGAGHGIGLGLATRFVEEGAAAVVVSDVDPDACAAAGEQLGQPHRPCDVGNPEGYAALLDWVEDDVGPIDLLCNNPAVFGGPEGGNFQTTEATWEWSWQVNVMAHVRSAEQLVPRMLRRGGGYFLQTVSAAGLITSNSSLAYTVTKHAAIGFAEWLVLNYGDRGIGVSCLCPTAVETRPRQFADLPGIGLVQTPAEVADVTVQGLEDERFLILPNPAVGGSFRKKATDYDAWISRTIDRIAPIKPTGPWDSEFPVPDPSETFPTSRRQ
ncbi:MAG TPA: SDR family oxidoreductase [Acidimicrobiales bacterium]|nr:SDR family oxidoreductase [Acidimicrobiales bacterium]